MKLDKWAFSLKNIVHQRFNTKLKDITKKKDIEIINNSLFSTKCN